MDIEALRERLRDYEQVIETMSCGLVAEDLDGRIVFVNQRLLDWLGYAREDLIGEPVEKLVPRELHRFMADDLRAVEAGDMRARLLAARRKDSTTFPVITLPQRFLDASGEFDGYFAIVVDLGAVMTARQVGPASAVDLRTTLQRIALELQSISLTTTVGATRVLPLQHPELRDLSPREAEVLTLLVGGDRVPAIAERLHISQHTVRNHLKSMFRKLDVGNQSELIEKIRKLSGESASSDPGPGHGALP